MVRATRRGRTVTVYGVSDCCRWICDGRLCYRAARDRAPWAAGLLVRYRRLRNDLALARPASVNQ